MFLRVLMFTMLCMLATPAFAGETVTYMDGDVKLEGYLARSQGGATGTPSPIIMIVHQWKGLTAYERMRADMLAKEGYTAFAIDMYGQGIRPSDDTAAGIEAAKYKDDPALARKRIQAALDYARTIKGADTTRIAVIGYCFGGGMALELARSGADIRAAISFHGNLASKAPVNKPGVIKAAIQVHHGADDPMVTHDEVHMFTKEMRAAQADWSLTMYGNAVHAFTQQNAGNDPSKGAAYNAAADARSWVASLEFLKNSLNR